MLQLAAAATSGGAGNFAPLIGIVLIFAVMYLFLIRPQQRRRREQLQMQSAVGPGDQIVTIGGLHGTVVSVNDEDVSLEVAPGVTVRFIRQAVARVVTRSEASATTGTAEPVVPSAEAGSATLSSDEVINRSDKG